MFKLLRYFSITSLIAFGIVAILAGVFYRQIVLSNLVEIAESKNVALTQAFSNSLWPQFEPFVTSASELSPEELQNHPQIAQLNKAVLAQMEDLSVAKVKVYDLNGLTVFSTEAAQIGEDKSDNAGYLAARSGQVASELTHRDTFSAFEQTIEDRDVFSSYIPIRSGGANAPIEGVFEVYDDVTPLIQRLEIAQRNVVIGVAAILGLLYVVLYFIVSRADKIIRQQYDNLVENIAERDQAETALRESEERYRILAENSLDLIALLNLEGKIIYASPSHYQVLGYKPKDIIHGSVFDVIHPDDKPKALSAVQNLLETGERQSVELQLQHGEKYWLLVEALLSGIAKGDGQTISQILLSARDITERKQAEEALQESEERLRQVFTSISDHIYVSEFLQNGERLNRYLSPTQTLTGYPLEKLLADWSFWPSKLIHPDDRAKAAAQAERLAQGKDSELEYRLIRADGEIIWVRDSGTVEKDATTGNYIVYGVVSDITQRKQVEQTLVLQEKRLRSLYEISTQSNMNIEAQFKAALEIGTTLLGLDIGIISDIQDDTYKVVQVYAHNAELSSGQIFDLEQTYCELTVKVNDVVAIDSVQESEYKGHPCYQQFNLESYIGVPIWVDDHRFGTLNFSSPQPTTTPFSEADKVFVRLMGQWVGTTLERINTQNELAQARDEALEASRLKSQLLANVSHDLRTPLNAILGYADMLQEGVYGPLPNRQLGVIWDIIDSTGQLLNFVNNLLDQARIESGQVVFNYAPFKPADLLEAVISTVGIMAKAKGLQVSTEISPDLPSTLSSDFYWLRQILINMVSNAIKFTEEGTIHIHLYKYDDKYWAIGVSDTGIGISTKDQTYIFEPFRQVDGTATRGHSGSGLGLSIVHQLISRLGGEIQLASQVGHGSTFTLKIPAEPTLEKTQ